VCIVCVLQTPTMTVPLLSGCDVSAARLLTSRMRRLKLAETLKGIKVGPRGGGGGGCVCVHTGTPVLWA